MIYSNITVQYWLTSAGIFSSYGIANTNPTVMRNQGMKIMSSNTFPKPSDINKTLVTWLSELNVIVLDEPK